MASKRYNEAMAYIAEWAANYCSDDILFDYEYDDQNLEATALADVSVGEYYQIETALEEKIEQPVAEKNEYIVIELIECPYCFGDLDCTFCDDTGEMTKPNTALDYTALQARVSHQHSKHDGISPTDIVRSWYAAIRTARILYPDG